MVLTLFAGAAQSRAVKATGHYCLKSKCKTNKTYDHIHSAVIGMPEYTIIQLSY